MIERVIGLIKTHGRPPRLRGERDEINDKFERLQEQKRLCESGREEPSHYFMSKTEWESNHRFCERTTQNDNKEV